MLSLRRSTFRSLAICALAVAAFTTQTGLGQQSSSGTRVVRPRDGAGIETGLSLGSPSAVRQLRAPEATAPRAGARYVPGQVLVKFSGQTVASASQLRSMQALGAREVEYSRSGDISVVTLESGADPEAVAAQLSVRADVEFAQANYLRQALFVPDDPFFNLQWNLTQIGLERAWDVNPGAEASVTVAVIDSGLAFEDVLIDYEADVFTFEGVDYPALGPVEVPFAAAGDLVSANRVVAPFDFVWGDEHPVDMSGHGSHVAGTVGQLTNNGAGVAGVAFNVKIMPLKVLADEWDFIFGVVPACCGAADLSVADAIRHAVENGADVINMSLGGEEESPVINDAVQFAVDQGVFVAIAGGNSFEEGNETIWPAAAAENIDGAMAVGAVDRNSGRAYYSNTGSYIEIVAPGGDQRMDGFDGVVQQTLDPFEAWTFLLPPSSFRPPRFDVLAFVFFQGTSMAAPHVAGLAALLISQGVTDPGAIEHAIKLTAEDLGDTGTDDEFGAGLIDAAAAVRGLGLAR